MLAAVHKVLVVLFERIGKTIPLYLAEDAF